MAYLNKVFLIGNLTRDPELRVTPKGTSICQFGLAVNRKFKGEDGSEREEVTFVDLEAWGKTGELVSKYLVKGSPAMIEGRLKFDQWEDKTTHEKRSKIKVVADNVQFLSSKNDRAGGEQAGGEAARSAPRGSPAPTKSPAAPSSDQGNLDEDIPF